MNDFPLVSIITPCYNGEKYLHRLFDSILNQTYKNIEFIFIDDGSTDNTKIIALSYKQKFEELNIKFLYLYQKNAGQAAAINLGLKYFKGEYLTWPDSDDWLELESIEKKVKFLETHKEYGLVMSGVDYIQEENMNVIGKYMPSERTIKCFFNDLILEKNVCFAPICYMIRTEFFLKSLPQKEIYPSRAGQNWQMLLPVAYNYYCGAIEEILCHYLIRKSSHSRQEKTTQEVLTKLNNHQEILVETIKSMDMSQDEKNKYYGIIENKYLVKKFDIISNKFNDPSIKNYYKLLKNKKLVTLNIWLKYKIKTNKFMYFVYNFIKKKR